MHSSWPSGRDFVTTIVICTGDSDFTPLVQKLRELDRRVMGHRRARFDVQAAPAGV
ncbi:MAG: hypothetical protein Ct9H300mP12_14820 [Acidimicrobiales bacterium]|nr:MAG: hypothetical protein Ct9H300mP12_14820 [Acidimicrobiales bacterium]